MRIAIVGAGLAGLSCGARLAGAGHAVSLFDKGRGPGGRLSHRRAETPLGEARFDHGAQYFTARDPGFRRQVDAWVRDGLAAPWPAAGDDALVGVPGMNAPAKALAAGLDVRCSARVERLTREGGAWRLAGEGVDAGPFDAAVVAVPAEQAGALVRDHAPDFADAADATPAAPCWTVMAAFPERLATLDDVVKRRGPVGWAARDSAKPGRSGPESWVVQAGPDWSREHLEEAPAAIVPKLLAALADAAGGPLPEPAAASAHRWRYARSGSLGRDALWDAETRLGVCGDWLLGPRVECAWMSGFRLAGMIGAA
ncbi:NAD(P)/FAD-dependent oxidoreductase [Lichenibacterium dinghuense]|uniref:NAD(P)/FAD-dependent oxidoreductase n=1 Tax=Lichenibacterium dinghuense TaxID=2895977 RepID=UPI001F2D0B49|nr:FAD-dependent oxidoreductase [Lichenibacterium sp. 6Y81]